MGGAQDLGGSETAPYDPVAGGTGHQAFVETRSMCSTKLNPRYWPIFCHKCPQGMQGVTRQAVCAQGGARGHSLSAPRTQFSVNLKLAPRKFVNLKKS